METQKVTMSRATVYGAGTLRESTLGAVADTVGGYTLTRTEGGWRAPDGTLVVELGWRVEIMSRDEGLARWAAAYLAGAAVGAGQSEVWQVVDRVVVEITRKG